MMTASYRSKRKKKKDPMVRLLIGFAILAAALILRIWLFPPAAEEGVYEPLLEEDALTVAFLDVGQGDAALILTPDGHAMLIDAGPASAAKTVTGSLAKFGVDRLDLAVFTHPHEDHIGGAPAVFDAVSVERVLLPDCVHDTPSYLSFLEAVDGSDAAVEIAAAGQAYTLGEAQISVLSPITGQSYDEINEYSLVLRLVWGETSFLFCGDAKERNEREMLASFGDVLDSTILKVGHHGSSTSSSEDFLDAVSPELAVISCGKDNDYGHPHNVTLKRFKSRTVPYLVTADCGTVLLSSDKKAVHRIELP